MSWFRKYLNQGESVFIVAEAGINHNGHFDLALELIKKAKESGANCVKFQTFRTEACESKHSMSPDYFKGRAFGKNKLDWSKRLEFTPAQFESLRNFCIEKNIAFLSTACDRPSLDILLDLGVPAIKIGSSDTNNLPLLRAVGASGQPVVLSTGISTSEDVDQAVITLRSNGNEELVLLQCTSQYPTPAEQINLRVMHTFKEKYNCIVGFSDHSAGLHIPVAAVTMGAELLEKHFTLSRNLGGVDQLASIEPHEFKIMVEQIRDVERSIGDGVKVVQPCEREHTLTMRKSLVASTFLPKGHELQPHDIEVKRPGGGLTPDRIDELIGKRVNKDIQPDDFIIFDLLDEP